MYKVVVECRDQCQDWEERRVILETDDVKDAIRQSKTFRDLSHVAWIEENPTPAATAKRLTSMYHLSASRKSSGIDGDYSTMDEAITRLQAYTDSFDDVIEASITKIK